MLSNKSFYADNKKLTVVVNHDSKVLLDLCVANLKEMCGLEKTQSEFKVLKDIINTIYNVWIYESLCLESNIMTEKNWCNHVIIISNVGSPMFTFTQLQYNPELLISYWIILSASDC